MPHHPTLTSSYVHHTSPQWTALFFSVLQSHLNDTYMSLKISAESDVKHYLFFFTTTTVSPSA